MLYYNTQGCYTLVNQLGSSNKKTTEVSIGSAAINRGFCTSRRVFPRVMISNTVDSVGVIWGAISNRWMANNAVGVVSGSNKDSVPKEFGYLKISLDIFCII